MFIWITSLIENAGYLGISMAMVLENIFPPLPSELIMILSGATAATGTLNIALVVLAGSIGSTLGLLPWFVAGRFFGYERFRKFADRHGKWLTFNGSDVDRAHRWFDQKGERAVFIGRFIPGVRTLIALPAAIMEMNVWIFIVYAFLGSIFWNAGFAAIGYVIGEQGSKLQHYVDLGLYAVSALAILWYVYRIITHKPQSQQ